MHSLSLHSLVSYYWLLRCKTTTDTKTNKNNSVMLFYMSVSFHPEFLHHLHTHTHTHRFVGTLPQRNKNPKLCTIKDFWSRTSCPVSGNPVSLTGHHTSNRIMNQNTALKWPFMTYDLWKELKPAVWRRPLQIWHSCRSFLKNSGSDTCWQEQTSHWELQKSQCFCQF